MVKQISDGKSKKKFDIDRRVLQKTIFDKIPADYGMLMIQKLLLKQIPLRAAAKEIEKDTGVKVHYTTLGDHVKRIRDVVQATPPTVILNTDDLIPADTIHNRATEAYDTYKNSRLPIASRSKNGKGPLLVHYENVALNSIIELEEIKKKVNIQDLTRLHAINLQNKIASDIMAKNPTSQVNLNELLKQSDLIVNAIPWINKKIPEYDVEELFMEFLRLVKMSEKGVPLAEI